MNRHTGPTTIAIKGPVNVRDARHVSSAILATTEQHYNQARGLEASRRHQAVLAGLQANLKRGPGGVGE